jgi:PAS domain S-box-containing protein
MLSILYVDDEPTLLEIAKLFLERNGQFSVDTITSAPAALNLLTTKKYDAIISDYQMPDMDGINFLKKVRTSGNTLPFILFTGRGREEVVIQAINEGVDFYLQKGGEPVPQFTELEHKIRQAVQRRRDEANIRDLERRETDIINFLPDATFAIDANGIVIAWNRAMEEMTGVKACEILGKGNYEYAIPFYRERRPILVDLVLHEDPALVAKYPLLKRDGQTLIAETTTPFVYNGRGATIWFIATPLFDRKGRIIGAIESIRDITERKRAEEAIRINSERLRMAQEIGHIGSWELDLATSNIWGSEEAFRIFAIPRPADGLSSLKDVETRIRDWEGVNRALTDLIKKGDESNIEYAIEPADNSPQKIIYSVGKIIYDSEKKPVRVAGVVHDITALKQVEKELIREHKELNAAYTQLAAQEGELRQRMNDIVESQLAIRESEEKYVSLFNRSLDLIYVHDLEGNFIDANPAALALLGYTRDDIPRLSFTSLISAEQIKKAQERIRTIVENGAHPDLIEYRLQKKNGEFVDIEAKGSLLLKDKKPYAIFGIARNITERKRAEEALRMTNRKLQLLSGISRHDIQNQLMSLTNAISFIDQDHLDQESRKWIRTAEKAAETITGQIGFTKDYENLGIKEPRWQSLREMFRHATLQFLMCDISLDMPAEDYEIYADQLMEKVFYNLLDNALRHGGDVTRISLSCREDDAGLRIFLQDNGRGVPDDDKLLIFRQGFGRNTGRGLFLSREILIITGITIAETGTYGNGARFEITVPKGGYRISCDT